MRQTIVIYKLSLNSGNLFKLRKNPEKIKKMVYERFNNLPDVTYEDNVMAYAVQIIKEDLFDYDNMILGRIIKYRHNEEKEKWDEQNKKIIKKVDENNILEKIYFIYEKNNEYLFLEKRSELDLEKAINVLKYVINYDEVNLIIDLNPLLNKKDAKTRIIELKKIEKAFFEIIPNNPNQKTWDVFENMNESFASLETEFKFKNKDSGLKYNQKMENLIDDVSLGHGRRYNIEGYDNMDEYQTINSHDHIKKIHKSIDNSTEGRIQGVWETLKEIL